MGWQQAPALCACKRVPGQMAPCKLAATGVAHACRGALPQGMSSTSNITYINVDHAAIGRLDVKVGRASCACDAHAEQARLIQGAMQCAHVSTAVALGPVAGVVETAPRIPGLQETGSSRMFNWIGGCAGARACPVARCLSLCGSTTQRPSTHTPHTVLLHPITCPSPPRLQTMTAAPRSARGPPSWAPGPPGGRSQTTAPTRCCRLSCCRLR